MCPCSPPADPLRKSFTPSQINLHFLFPQVSTSPPVRRACFVVWSDVTASESPADNRTQQLSCCPARLRGSSDRSGSAAGDRTESDRLLGFRLCFFAEYFLGFDFCGRRPSSPSRQGRLAPMRPGCSTTAVAVNSLDAYAAPREWLLASLRRSGVPMDQARTPRG